MCDDELTAYCTSCNEECETFEALEDNGEPRSLTTWSDCCNVYVEYKEPNINEEEIV